MAEALGVASGIAGLLSLTVQITKTVVKFGLDWKHAPKEVKSLMTELQSLKSILSETQTNLVLNADFTDAFEDRTSILLSELGPNAPSTTETKLSIQSCVEELENLLGNLRKREKGHRIGWERFKAPFCAKELRESISTINRRCRILNEMVSIDTLTVGVNILGEVKEARKDQQAWYEAQENQKILDWLSSLSFEEKHRDIFSKHQPGTGEWFLELDKFKSWRNNDSDKSSTIWCTGIPGAGKSVMTSIVIEHLRETCIDHQFSMAYVYCDYKDHKRQTAASLLGCLVKQMVLQQGEMPEEVTDLYKKAKTSPSVEDCTSLLSSLMSGSKRSFLFVDALDEHITNEDDENISDLAFLDELLQLQHRPLLQERLAECIRAEIYAANTDIEKYLRSRIYDHTKFKFAGKMLEDAELARTTLDSLSRKAQGMFLLPRLHLDRLSCQTSVRGLRRALDTLPTKLDETYNEALTRIRGQVPEHCELAMSALAWISHALRPLTTRELLEALAVKPGDQSLDPEALPDIALIVSASAGLITVDGEGQQVRLVHFTVEEYFQQRKLELFPDANFIMAQTCITCLSFDISRKYIFAGTKFIRSGEKLISFDDLKPLTKYNPFKESNLSDEMNGLLDYAVENWGPHLRGEAEHALQDEVLDFLSDEMGLHYPQSMVDNGIHARPCALHLIVFFNLGHILSTYLSSDHTSNIQNGSYFIALHLAVFEGHEEIAKLFLAQADMNVDGLDMVRQTPLSLAAELGRIAIFSMLLEREDDVSADSKDISERTPLSYAAEEGHESIMRMLIDRDDVDADSKDKRQKTPLRYAAEKGRESIVRMLLNRDDVAADYKDEDERTPLSCAAENGHEAIVRMLLDRDDVTADYKNTYGITPLSYAARKGREGIVKMLLDRDDVIADSKDDRSRTSLSYAAKNGHESIVRMLLDRDDVTADSKDKFGETPLSYAAKYGYEDIVRMLLDRDDVTADYKNKFGETPLSYAAKYGYEDIVRMLLDRDDVTADYKNRDSLSTHPPFLIAHPPLSYFYHPPSPSNRMSPSHANIASENFWD